jgi:glucan phosphoethanolaminetransferase (alkaline phosphatase superfamily)
MGRGKAFECRISQRLLLGLKLSLLVLFLCATNRGVLERLASIGWQVGLVVFVCIWVLSVTAILAIAFSGSVRSRAAWTLVLAGVSFLGLSYHGITAKQLSYAETERLLGLTGFVDNLAGFYTEAMISAACWSLLGIVAINMPPFYTAHRRRRWVGSAVAMASMLQLLPVAAIGAVLYARGGEGTDGLPVQHNGVAFLSVLAIESAVSEPSPPRTGVLISPSAHRKARHVVLVMDESVRGDLLDINSEQGVESGLLRSGLPIINFGIASSIANCSGSTNMAVRMGVTRRNYLKEIRSNPSIWAYAKKAGFRTVYLDGQRHGGWLQNGMEADELMLVDEFFQFDAETPLHERDSRLGEKLKDLLVRSDAPLFVMVNKMGAHFPYEGKYPREETVYRPTMAASYFGTEVDPQVKVDLSESPDNRQRFKNSYLNAIKWNTSQFFARLLSDFDLQDTVIAYTSDHGQDFHDDGRPGFGTHCGDGVPEEGMVPLVIVTRAASIQRTMKHAALTNAGRASQFNLFPTLLTFMGYEESDLTSANGFEPTLFQTLPDDNQRFLSTFNVRWGKKPAWHALRGVGID